MLSNDAQLEKTPSLNSSLSILSSESCFSKDTSDSNSKPLSVSCTNKYPFADFFAESVFGFLYSQ